MLKIIDEGHDEDVCNNWDEEGNPPSNIYLEDSKGQCVAQVLCSNAEEQATMCRLLAASTDMKTLLEAITEMDNQVCLSYIKIRIQSILDYIKGV